MVFKSCDPFLQQFDDTFDGFKNTVIVCPSDFFSTLCEVKIKWTDIKQQATVRVLTIEKVDPMIP